MNGSISCSEKPYPAWITMNKLNTLHELMQYSTVLSKTLNCSSHTLPPLGAYYASTQRYRTLLERTVMSYWKFIPKPLCNITHTCEQIMNSVQSRMSLYSFYTFLSVCLYSQPPMRHRKKCSDFGLYPDF